MATKKKVQEKKLADKSYRLLDDRSGEAFLLKTGKNKRLLIFDHDLKINRAIRHCPNEQTIFLDEQSSHALVEPIIFEFGNLTVPYTDQITQIFLDNHPDNKANGGSWFEEINEEVEATEEIEVEELIQDIKFAVREKEKEEEGIYALETVVSVLVSSVSEASKMTKAELKRAIYNAAENNPYYFTDDNGNVNIFDDENVNRKYLTLKSINEGIIKKSPNNKSIVWAKDNKVIATAPIGLDLLDYFADFLSTDEGILVIEELKRRF